MMDYKFIKTSILEKLEAKKKEVDGISDPAWNALVTAEEIVKATFRRAESTSTETSLSTEILKSMVGQRQYVLEQNDPNDEYLRGIEDTVKRVLAVTAKYSANPDTPATHPKTMWWEFSSVGMFGQKTDGPDRRVRVHMTQRAMQTFGQIFDVVGIPQGYKYLDRDEISKMWLYQNGSQFAVEVRRMDAEEMIGRAGYAISGEERYE